MRILLAVTAGFLLDCVLGDPVGLPHPVILIGKLISKGENICRRIFPKSRGGENAAGAAMALAVLVITAAAAYSVLCVCRIISPALEFAAMSLMCWQILAAKCLKDEAKKVEKVLKDGDIEGARRQVGMLVGRDTASLTETQVIKATVETVAENTCDGVVAPLFYMMIGGPVAGLVYKAVNTMDSMVGYKNDRYINFGRCPAKTDDVFNFIPARISGWAMVAAAYIGGFDGKNALKIYLRDKRKHSSPNSAQTESACAGALDIQLAGNASYFGKVYEKPYIGDPLEKIGTEHIGKSCKLMYMTSVICLLVFGAVRLFLVR